MGASSTNFKLEQETKNLTNEHGQKKEPEHNGAQQEKPTTTQQRTTAKYRHGITRGEETAGKTGD